MDPQATWQHMIDSYCEGDIAAATEAAEDLVDWLTRGGFPPQVLPDRPMNDGWNRNVAVSACRFIIAKHSM